MSSFIELPILIIQGKDHLWYCLPINYVLLKEGQLPKRRRPNVYFLILCSSGADRLPCLLVIVQTKVTVMQTCFILIRNFRTCRGLSNISQPRSRNAKMVVHNLLALEFLSTHSIVNAFAISASSCNNASFSYFDKTQFICPVLCSQVNLTVKESIRFPSTCNKPAVRNV